MIKPNKATMQNMAIYVQGFIDGVRYSSSDWVAELEDHWLSWGPETEHGHYDINVWIPEPEVNPTPRAAVYFMSGGKTINWWELDLQTINPTLTGATQND